MATLTTQQVTRTGLAPAFAAAAAGGDKFVPNKDTILHIKNGSGGSLTATIVTPKEAFSGAAIADIAVAVPAAGERIIGPFPYENFADPSDALANLTYSGVTSLTVAVYQVQEQ